MKNFIKKIVSSALVLALMLTGVSALAFTDMEDSENSTLMQKLGIISGYEDGSFRPDADVTRAEAAAMMVRALGWSDEDADDFKYAAQRSGNDFFSKPVSGFADYNPDYWANGYLQIALENNVLSGFDDNTIRPEDNVTIEQLLTMIMCAIGYKTYAEASGGYPVGYITWAASQGIDSDISVKVSDYGKNAARKEVLDCIANAMNAPICVISSYETSWDGRIVPNLEIKDGNGRDWQTLLTREFSVYTAAARAWNVTKEKISADILSSLNFDDMEITAEDKLSADIKLTENCGNIKNEGEYRMYIRALDSDEKDYELVYAFPVE